MHTLEQVADSFVKDLQKRGFESAAIRCVGDSRSQSHAPSSEDVHAFLRTLNQDEAIRFEVSDDEVADELIHAAPMELPVDIDLDRDESRSRVILGRKRNHHFVYFAGFYKFRALWTHDARRAQVFESEDAIIVEAFQFNEDGGAILQHVFSDLGLQLLPAPKEA